MAGNRNDQILRFLVQAEGVDALKPFLESVKDLEGASDETRKAADALLSELEAATGLQKTLTEFEKLSASLGRTTAAYDAAKAKVDALAKQIAATEQPSRRQTEEFDRAQASLTRYGNALAIQEAKLGQLSTELKTAGLATNNFAAAQAQIQAKAQQAAQGLTQLATAARTTKTEQEALAARLADGDEAFRRQAEASRSAREALERVRASTAEAAQAQADAATKSTVLGAAWSKLAAIGATLAGYLSINAAIQGVKNLLGLADATERTRKRLTDLYGSAEAGERAFAQLRTLSQSTGQEFAATAEAAAKLKSFGIEPLNGSLQALIDQNARVGGSQETLNGLILAVGQAWAKQKLQGEEILQLVERGVPVWDLLAQATGKNVTELQKLSSEGELGRDVIAKLIAEIGKSASGAAAQNLTTFGGLITQLKDRWQQFLQSIADAGVLDLAKQKLTGLIDEATRLAQNGTLTQWAKSAADGIASVVNVVTGAIKVTYEYGGAIVQLGKAYATIKVAQLVADLGTLIARKYAAATAATALGTATAAASTQLGGLGAAIGRIPRSLQVAVGILGAEAAISAVGNMVEAYGQLREAQAKLNIERKDLGAGEAKLAAQIEELKTKYQEYADVAIKSTGELRDLSGQQTAAYQQQLEGALRYYRAIEVEARNAGDVAGFQRARQQVIEFQAELGRVKDAVRKIATETTVVQPVVSEFATKLVAMFREAYKEGTNAATAIREEFGKIDVTTVQGLTDAVEAIREIGKVSTEAGEAIQQDLRAKLLQLSDEDFAHVLDSAEVAFRGSSEEAKAFAAAIGGISLERLGVDLQALQTGFSVAGASAIDNFGKAIGEVEKLGLAAEQQSKAIAQAFDGAFAKVSTRPELEALRKQLQQAFEQGKISAEEYQAKLAQLNTRLEELANKSKPAAENTRQVAGAMRDAAASADDAANETERAAKSTANFGEAAAAAKVDLGNMSQALIDSAMAMQMQARSGKEIIEIWKGVNREYVDQNRQVQNRLETLRKVVAANDEEGRSLERLKARYSAINDGTLSELQALEEQALELRRKKAQETNAAADAEERYRKEVQQTLATGQGGGALEYVRRIAVDVNVRADPSAGSQTLSPAVLEQIVAKITPTVTRAVIDELERDQQAAGF